MNIFKNRPLALGCAVFLISLASLYYEDIITSLAVLCVGILLLCTSFAFVKMTKAQRLISLAAYLIPIALAFIISSVLSATVYQRDKAEAGKLNDLTGIYTVVIESEEFESGYRSAYIGRIEELGIRAVIGSYDSSLDLGQVIEADLSFEFLDNGKYGTDASGRYLEDGILIGAECKSFSVLKEGKYTVSSFFKIINKSLTERYVNIANSDTSPIVAALFLGNRSYLTQRNTRDFARLGISHILALSGMHLSIIAAMTSGMLTGIGFGKRWRYILTVSVVLLFICLTGFSSSVMRAGLMLIIFYVMFFFRQRADFITRIFLAVSIICIILPYSIFSTSLILSFFAMLGCVITSYIMSKRRSFGKLRGIIGAVITTVTVSLITLPITFLRFDFISLVSPIANLVFIPLFTLLLYLCPLLLAFGNIPILGTAIVWACEGLTSVILYLTHNVSLMGSIAIPFNSKLHPYSVIVIFLSLILFMAIDRKRIYIPMVSLAVGFLIFATGSIYVANDLSSNSYVFTDSSDDGDITYIRNGKKASVIDCYPTSKSVTAEVYRRISDMGYCEIENYILADYSYYSFGALDYITDCIVVRNVILPDPVDEYEEEMYDMIYASLTEKGTAVRKAERNIDLGSLKVKMAQTEFLKRSEKRLVAFSVEGESSRYTYVGASVYEGIHVCAFAESYIQCSDVIYFGIYGPKFKMRFDFDISNADYCIFSPLANYYSHCHTEGVKRELPGKVFILK